MTRREFLQLSAALTVAPELASGASPARAIPRRRLGRTGVELPMVGLGGWHVGCQSDEKESIAIVRAAIDGGITFLDNCWDYNEGQSELRMGKALRDGYRNRAFLMTKVDGRDRRTASRQLEESLRRLRTDHLDLVQLHEVIYPNDPERAFAPGGAIEALAEAKKAGKARFVGFTGHKSPEIHLAMLRAAAAHGFRFDTVQMPLNVLDAHHDSFEKKVLPVLLEEGIGVLGMKSMGDGLVLESKAATPEECLHYQMSLPVSVTITGCDSMKVLDQALRVARGFTPLLESEIESLLARTAAAAQGGRWEKYKTEREFDGTFASPEWLGTPA